MLGLDGYGSDSGSGSGSENERLRPTKTQPASAKSLKPLSTSNIPLPPPKTTKRPSKKITIGLPALRKDESEEQDGIESERPAAKRQRTGAGASSLLTMLPAPQQKTTAAPPQERVLGGGKGPGLAFNVRQAAPSTVNTAFTEGDEELEKSNERPKILMPTKTANSEPSLPFLPPSLAQGKPNTALEGQPKIAKKASPNILAAPPVDDFLPGLFDTINDLKSSG
jgi:hypothetical protein